MHVTTVAAGGVDLVVREWGRENPDPLLFWPALNPWGSLQLLEAAPLLVQRGFRVASIAAPGTGESPTLADAEQYLPRRLAELVLDVAAALSLEQLGFVGASWGASIGVHLAGEHPDLVRALVLLDGGYADVTVDAGNVLELEQAVAADQKRFAFESWAAYVTWAREHASRWSDELEVRYRAGMTEAESGIVTRADAQAAVWALWGLSQERVTEAHAALGRAGVPTLLIVPADLDAAADIERFQAHARQAVVRRIDAGHDLLQDRPEATV